MGMATIRRASRVGTSLAVGFDLIKFLFVLTINAASNHISDKIFTNNKSINERIAASICIYGSRSVSDDALIYILMWNAFNRKANYNLPKVCISS